MRERLRSLRWVLVLVSAALLGLCSCGGRSADNGKPSLELPLAASCRVPQSGVEGGTVVLMDYRFEPRAGFSPPSQPLRVFVHFLDENGSILFQDDHDPVRPTTEWTAGKAIEYRRPLYLESRLFPYAQTITVVGGLYDPAGALGRIKLAGKERAPGKYELARLSVTPAVKGKVAVLYREGWYEEETDPVRREHWRWSNGDGTCVVRNEGADQLLYVEAWLPQSRVGRPESPVTIVINGREAGRLLFTQASELWCQPLSAEQRGDKEWIEVAFHSSGTFVPTTEGLADDDRRLGVMIKRIHSQLL